MTPSNIRAVVDLGMNERAWTRIEGAFNRAHELRVKVRELSSGARVLDAGIEVTGGYGAGKLLAELCMGGLGHVDFVPVDIGGEPWPGLQVWTDHPAEACMGGQYAGWAVAPEGYFAMGSGPLRSIARVEKELYAAFPYSEDAARGVLILEGPRVPTDDVVRWIARKAGIDPAAVALAIAPTASTAGGVQVVARVIETGLHKMHTLGFDITLVETAIGTAPLPPTARNDVRAIGRTNDAVLYGGRARYVVRAEDDLLADLARRLPASASADYGASFFEIFERYGRDFYKIDPLLFSPAEVWLTSATSGRTFHAGRIDPAVLRRSLFED
jgi:methenyltetrahydromethanopterin cyclohydrolase